ncbi:hypothetical protein C8P67_11042 [Flavobacterium aquicola]|uniref:Uncharacterized protein n=1 Tax=Flavobacterium aquicola TaxID=1682742 RepID=A0A3E0ED99_9FLAO|nr:hypothetical protein C8P67_11042 [Flavobacterium aquicola]
MDIINPNLNGKLMAFFFITQILQIIYQNNLSTAKI